MDEKLREEVSIIDIDDLNSRIRESLSHDDVFLLRLDDGSIIKISTNVILRAKEIKTDHKIIETSNETKEKIKTAEINCSSYDLGYQDGKENMEHEHWEEPGISQRQDPKYMQGFYDAISNERNK